MTDYLLIQSRDPFESRSAAEFYDLAAGLVKSGSHVILFLIQDGVLPARECVESAALANTADAGVQILADNFSLHERGIAFDGLIPAVEAADVAAVVDGMASGRKSIWN
jgi:sulfur relay (sulfurtransferase) complex TusBCD TusD component (DsrE family)